MHHDFTTSTELPRLQNLLPPIDLNLSFPTIRSNLKRTVRKHLETRFKSSDHCSFHLLCPYNRRRVTPSCSFLIRLLLLLISKSSALFQNLQLHISFTGRMSILCCKIFIILVIIIIVVMIIITIMSLLLFYINNIIVITSANPFTHYQC